MRIAIHKTKHGFDGRWIQYCQEKNIPYKIVSCYASDIIKQLEDCDALMWHINHGNARDNKMAKALLFALQQAGKVLFPDFNTAWHFDDKVGQKYLLESLHVPFINTYTFYTKSEALQWIQQTTFPKVFKLRGGAGSANVKLVHSKDDAIALVSKAFGRGFAAYDAWGNMKDRIRLYRKGKTNATDVMKGAARFFRHPESARMAGREKGYVYFQDFVPNNDCDIRVVVIDEKAFAIKRMVRDNDFRASGSGFILYRKELFDEKLIQMSFDIADKIQSQAFAVDYVFDENKKPLVVEFSFGFSQAGYEQCEGYWDKQMTWHAGKFNPQAWMVDDVIKKIKAKKG